jgi:hypothetical protein
VCVLSALKNVPLVKLDAVDEVMKLFTDAVELMESSLELDDEDERAANSSATPTSAGGAASFGQSKLLSLASASTATTATSSAASSASSSDSESEARGTIPPLQNKAIQGVAMTVDYSSPSSKTRSLGKQAKADAAGGPSSRAAGGGATSLGLGLKGTGGGGGSGAAKPGVLGLHGTHKPSSRATMGLSALNASASSSSSPNSPAMGTASPVSPITPEDEVVLPASAASVGADGQAPLKNKLVAKISGAPSSREYPSPKLGPRSLSSAPGARPAGTPTSSSSASPTNSAVQSPANPAAAGLSLPMAESLGRDAPASSAQQQSQSGLSSPADDDDGPEDESEQGDLIRTDKKNSVFNRVKSTLPVTASPKQIRSSFHLLELATTHSLQAMDEDDLTAKAQGGNGAATSGISPSSNGAPSGAGPQGVLSSLPTGLTTPSTGTTPKPAFLRRLDSPETHHGQLIAAKARLQMLINRGLQVADKVRLDKVPEIKAALEKALQKLEASLVTPGLSHG